MKKSNRLLAVLAVPLVIAMLMAPQVAKAHVTPSLTCTLPDGTLIHFDDPLPPNTRVMCTADATGNWHTTEIQLQVMDALGNTLCDNDAKFAHNSLTKTLECNFKTKGPGETKIWAFFFNDQETRSGTKQELVFQIHVSFLVTPESPIGAAALIGSSMAALGGFVALRYRGAKP